MTLTLLTAYNVPYLAALTFVLLTGIAELIALLCGHSLSSAMDTPDLPEGLTGEALDWLNIGRIPPADRPLYAGRVFLVYPAFSCRVLLFICCRLLPRTFSLHHFACC
ncbi:YqiJ family protein [Escherichia coli]|nr:YqiJ family protein [Escherichia coli]